MKYKGAFKLEDNIKEIKEKCFVITPIGNESDPIRRHIDGIIEAVIEPALSDKYEVVVSHKINEPGTITRQIIKEIYEDKLVIVNLTERNPNVMYELAFRHSLGKPVILIAEKGTGLPSDIISERTIFYENDAKGTLELKERIRKAENEIDFEKTSSPIYDMLKEIGQEISILENEEMSAEGNVEDKNMLRYILERLGKIENMIVNNGIQTVEKTDRIKYKSILYRFSTQEDENNIEQMLDELKKSELWKNLAYDRFGIKPVNVFARSNKVNILCEALIVRIDNVNRLGESFAKEMSKFPYEKTEYVGYI